MHVRVVPITALTLLASASAASACDECLRTGRNVHLPSEGSFSPRLLGTASNSVSPAFSSRPGAVATLLLDFDGIVWEGTWAGRTPGTVPAYDLDGNPSTFTAGEIQDIHHIWTRVAEAYSPFDVNVTTVDPGDFTQPRVSLRVVIGGSNEWYSTGAGGVAYVGGFTFSSANAYGRTSWVFEQVLQPRDNDPPVTTHVKKVADATIHEAGHQFGLSHQAWFDENGNFVDSYRRSTDGGFTAPNMGVAYQAIRSLWSDGPRAAGNPPQPVQQLDLDILSSTVDDPAGSYWNGFGFRPDDWGNDIGSALQMSHYAGVLTSFGVIEQSTDADLFYFFSEGGDVQIEVDGAQFGQMLDVVLNLYDSAGDLLFTDSPPLALDPDLDYGLDASFAGFLDEGDYYLGVLSNGGYGDIGQFFVTVTGAVSVPEPGAAVVLLALCALLPRRRVR